MTDSVSPSRNNSEPHPEAVAFEAWWKTQDADDILLPSRKWAAWNGWLARSTHSEITHAAPNVEDAGMPMGDPHPCDMTPEERERFFSSVDKYDYTQGDDEGDESYVLRLVGRASELEASLHSADTPRMPDVETLLDNAACASQVRELLRTDDGDETVLREAVRMSVYEPLAKLLTPSASAQSDAKDAARYRWLRENDHDGRRLEIVECYHGEMMDHRIDKAMSAADSNVREK